MPYIDHIRALNHWQPDNFLPFVIDGQRMGYIRHAFADQLARFPECFVVTMDEVMLNPQLTGFAQRSNAVAEVLECLSKTGVVKPLMGEMFPVLAEFGTPAAMQIDRAMVSQFGIRAFGQHLNGYVETGDGMMMWIARRASDRRAFPDRLDQLVAGGLPHGISLQDNLIKECHEEADMPGQLACTAKAVGSVSYCCEVEHGLRDDTLLCYDLLLPEEFMPRCNDGEVAGFELMPIEKVAAIVSETESFKPNCNLVIIDFLLRHGFIHSEHVDHQTLYNALQKGSSWQDKSMTADRFQA
ncbi:hypothetical protein MMIC_P0029 [Mariprofundus micogutta]|uniref:DUF4743 domain-containing protein n=1 Tax=Mariprofundus micogutta TaxID=1921010 RepID=A0A1L8CJN3_9PROT|nr:DUF4743 domain-containing protein [Mariprofundus micogutta]GAV19100.1 hypothetical protein MMIC_P0029 [Mariprofundus micogutta]